MLNRYGQKKNTRARSRPAENPDKKRQAQTHETARLDEAQVRQPKKDNP
jgi:hypothetical protein